MINASANCQPLLGLSSNSSLLNLVFVFVDQQTKDIAGQSANGLVSNRPMPMTTGCTENHQEFKKFNANAPIQWSAYPVESPFFAFSMHSRSSQLHPHCSPGENPPPPPGCKLRVPPVSPPGANWGTAGSLVRGRIAARDRQSCQSRRQHLCHPRYI